MPLKIVHCADLHIGAPCQGLSSTLAAQRSSEIRSSLSEIVNFCKEKKVDALLICGDLFDTPDPSGADCDFVRDTLSSLSPIDVFILCGNHDYMCAQSPFLKEDYFSDNVHIFPCFEHSFEIPGKNVVFWGKSYSSPTTLASFSDCVFDSKKINIMCLHGDLTKGSTYNIINKETLSSLKPDYAAFGHIHNAEIFDIENTACAYCGTPEGHKFNDDGATGFIYAEISKENSALTHICLTKRKYRNIYLDITGKDTLSVIEEAKSVINPTDLFRLTLQGTLYENEFLSSEIIQKELAPLTFYIEVSDSTTPGYDLDSIEKEEGLRGEFLRQLRTITDNEEDFLNSARAGLDALSGRVPDVGGVL